MRDLLSTLAGSYFISNAIRMIEEHFDVAIVVESKTDSVGYKWLLNTKKCKIIGGNGKDNIINAIESLNKDSNIKVKYLAIIDSDFDNIFGRKYTSNIYSTDSHDIEMEILKTHTLHKFDSFHLDNKLLDTRSIELLLEPLLEISYLKMASMKYNLGLNFKDINVIDFIDEDNKINLESYISKVISNTQAKIKLDHVLEMFNLVKKNKYDLWNLLNGHDSINLLVSIINKEFGKEYSEYDLTNELQKMYDSSSFVQSILYKDILEWEEKNSEKVLEDRYRYKVNTLEFAQN